MKERITVACAEIPAEMLEHVQQSLHGRLEACIQAGGGHFEQNL